MPQSFVYIMANRKNGTLYIGVTAHLFRRNFEHKNDVIEGFTKKYGIHKLVYYEEYDDIRNAIHREKCLKEWKRSWKIQLIESTNPCWKDLYYELAA
jgi:putative endonuclease